METIIVRMAERLDGEALSKVFAAAYEPFKIRIPDLPDVASGLPEDIINHHVWVVEIQSQIVGGIVLSHDQDNFHLTNIAVHPDCGGKGIGRKLISTVEEFASSRGGTLLVLATHVDMPDNISFYQRLGWQETGREGNKVLMVKNIGRSKRG